MKPAAPLKLFCSYAHADEDGLVQLRSHLSGLRRQKLIEDWHDRQIPAGGKWDAEIEQNLNQADLILLLLSADFIHSDYCMEIETVRALARQEEGSATVIPIFWRECDVKDMPFSSLQDTPRDMRWIDRPHNDQNKAWTEVAKAIRDAVWRRRGMSPIKRVALDLITPVGASPRFIPIVLTILLCTIALGVGAYYWWSRTSMQIGETLLQQGEYLQAQQACEAALLSFARQRCLRIASLMLEQREPELFYETAKREDSAYALVVLGEAEANQQNFVDAEMHYGEAIKRNLRIAQAYFGMGQIRHLQNRPDQAYEWYQQAVDHAPRNRRFLLNLASIHAERGELEQAESAYRKLLRVDANLMLAYVELLDVLLKQKKLDQAVELAKQGLSLLEQSPELKDEPLNRDTWFIMVDGEPRYLESWELKRKYLRQRFALAGETYHK